MPQSHWLPKIQKVKHDKKDIKLIAAKKITLKQIHPQPIKSKNFFFFKSLSPVAQKLSQERELLRIWDQCQS